MFFQGDSESIEIVVQRTTQLLSDLNDRLSAWSDLYRDLHMNPELSMQEHRTAGIVARHLRDVGYEVTEGVGHTVTQWCWSGCDAPGRYGCAPH